MTDLSKFDPSSVGNPDNNIFGLPFTEEEARMVILPIPWEVTVSPNAGTARAPTIFLLQACRLTFLIPKQRISGDREST